MADSRHIAGLAGPTLMVMTTSEALNLDIWAGVSPTLVYLNGLMLFVAGLAIVRTHNVWSLRWPLLVTLLGWAALAVGTLRMFAPRAPQLAASASTYAVILLLFLLGAFLTLQAFRRPRDPAA
ncbi:hypothetical protein [Phenylobacterium sp.]|uniref:hypothetical protein n=1 Tax=Phenylobacterium sp. TaxID=1871053 RepID=UPI0027162A2E|nr:hypothetical protein [Phenylobacterium sp.]MDO8801894.1 hypothetical protein [Phenylobacterium sp.]